MGGTMCSAPSVGLDEEELNALSQEKDCLFDARELQNLMQMWLLEHPKGVASTEDMIAFFSKAQGAGLSASDKESLERTVNAFDRDHDGLIDFKDAVLGLSVLLRGDHRQKVEFLFRVLDQDKSNSLSKAELRDAMKTQLRTLRGVGPTDNGEGDGPSVTPVKTGSTMAPSPTVMASAAVDAIFADGELDEDGALSLEEFLKLVEASPLLKQHFALADAVSSFNVQEASVKQRLAALRSLASCLDVFQDYDEDNTDLDAAMIAQVLSQVPGLSPIALGEFLGSREVGESFKQCSRSFFSTQQLSGVTLDEGMRRMSQRLCLPREAQQIDRIVQAFSETFCSANPGSFADVDAAYLTAFAIVMLNADAHTPNVKTKMTKAQFVKNCRLATPTVPESLLQGIYDRVKAREIKLGAGASYTDIEGLLCNTGRAELSTLLSSITK